MKLIQGLRWFIIIICLGAFIVPTLVHADLIFLKNGKIIEGSVKNPEGPILDIETGRGIMKINKSTVERIQYQPKTNEFTNFVLEVYSDVKKENTDRVIQYLVAKGVERVRMTFEDPYYKVNVGPFPKESEALDVSQKIGAMGVPFVAADKLRIIQIKAKQAAAFFEKPSASMVQTNIALSENGAKVEADSFQEGFPALNAVDGNVRDPESRWISKNIPGSHSLVIQFPEPKPFERIEIYTGGETDPAYVLKDFSVQYWNGVEWVDLGNVRGNLAENPSFSFSPVTSNRVRLYVTGSNYLDNAARVFEINVLSKQERQMSALPREKQTRAEFNLIDPEFLKSNGVFTTKPGQWYEIPVKLTYEVTSATGINLAINPDFDSYWKDLKFREYIGLSTVEASTTLNFDTKFAENPTVEGLGQLKAHLRSRTPARPGTYPRSIRVNFYDPANYNMLRTREFTFQLVVE